MTPVPEGAPSSMSDAERDAYLEVALRHAPDAGIDAPAALSAAILREARGAAAQAAPQRTWSGTASGPSSGAGVAVALLRLWTWLARPPVAGAFASLMLATLVGVMWWGEPIERALERPLAKADYAPAGPAAPAAPAVPAVPAAPAERAERVAPVPAVTSVEPRPALTERSVALADAGSVPPVRQRAQASPGVADPPAVAAARATLQSSPPQAGSAAAHDSAARLARQAQASPGAARLPADESSPAGAAPTTAGAAGTGAMPPPDEMARPHLPGQANPAMPEANERAGDVRAAAAAGVGSNAGPSADVPPPRATAEATQPPKAKAEAETTAREMNAMIPPAAAPSAQGARPPVAVTRAETRRRVEVQASNLGRLAAPAPPVSAQATINARPLLSLRLSMLTRGEGWSWRTGTAVPRPVDAALRQWLARLDNAAGDGWQEAGVSGDAQAPGIVLELLLDGLPRARIQLDTDSVRFSDNADTARPLRAELSAPAVQDLRTVLEALAR